VLDLSGLADTLKVFQLMLKGGCDRPNWKESGMSKIDAFEREQESVRRLDFQGYASSSKLMLRQYQRRNAFGLGPDKEIHRIFQKDFLDKDISDGYLSLPKASASIWHDPLENPLAEVKDVDLVTGSNIHLGALVSSFYAICWTDRSAPRPSDWSSFSHGKKAVRVSTTVGKIMDRMMCAADPCYMHRAWLIEVDYEDPDLIQAMKNPHEAYRRIESQGALLALSAAVVRSQLSTEDEVRLLFDASVEPSLRGLVMSTNRSLARIPFEWKGFIDNRTCAP